MQVSPSDKQDAVPSGDVPIAVLMHKIHSATDYWQKKKHEEQLMEELMVGVCIIVSCISTSSTIRSKQKKRYY